jgi:hypothetical protein
VDVHGAVVAVRRPGGGPRQRNVYFVVVEWEHGADGEA